MHDDITKIKINLTSKVNFKKLINKSSCIFKVIIVIIKLITYYDRYILNVKKIIEDLVINYLLNFKKNSIEIEGSIPDELFNKLDVQRQKALEDHRTREKTLNDICTLIT